MTNIAQNVRDFLNKNPYLVKALDEKILNVRAFAISFLRKTKADASVDSVISGVRRFEGESKKENKDLIKSILGDSRISTKSRLSMLQIKRHFKILKTTIPDILGTIHVSKGEVLRVFEGRQSLLVVIDHSKLNNIKKLIPKNELVDVIDNIGEVNISFSDKFHDMPGIISPIFNELAINDINVVGHMGSETEQIFFVNEEDISKCHDLLLRFFYGESHAD